MTIVAMRIMQTKRPVSGDVIGERIVLAHHNNARWDPLYECYVQSYAPCYRICESGDYFEITPETMERFLHKVMKWHKITKMVMR